MGETKRARKVRILAIAPYEALYASMVRIADTRDDISMEIFLGNMKDGAEIARYHENGDYDVIISRGATARLIKEAVRIPMIEVDFSPYDILRAIKLAENYPHKYAIAGFSGITKIARILCDLLQKEIEIVTIYREEDAPDIIRDLKRRGYSMVVCGTVGHEWAKKLGMASILILSGDESVESAFEKAVEMSQGYSYMRERKTLYEQVLGKDPRKTMLFDGAGEICFSNWDPESGDLERQLREELGEMPEEGLKKAVAVRNVLYEAEGSWIYADGARYGLFQIQEQKLPSGTSRQGLFFSDRRQAEHFYHNSFFGASGALGMVESQIDALRESRQPAMIVGEEGCGKDLVARYLYMHSVLSNRPFVIIDCEAVNEKTWAFLMKGSDSPFWEGNQTFYIRNVDRLSESWCRQIQSMIMERELHRRSQLLFTCVQERGKGMPERVLRLVNLLSCSVARLPSLRECRGEIAMLASLYIAKKNVEFSKQILGFEPGAVELMQEYQWPYNYTQLKRVLDELTAVTPTSYISRRDIAHCLEKERQLFGGAGEGEAFDFDRPLHEIDRDIIRRQLSLAHGNQAAAARRLGISRTTLWRYLKDEKEGQ